MAFTHLHVHTEYSLLDGISKLPDLVALAKQSNYSSLAITDHGTLGGTFIFYKLCQGFKIKPILGCELYFVEDYQKAKEGKCDICHLVTLAKNRNGFKNLIKLVSESNLKFFYKKNLVDWNLLEKYHEDIIATSSCMEGHLPKLYRDGHNDSYIKRTIEHWLDLFKDNFYIEIQTHYALDKKNKLSQQDINRNMFNLSKQYSLPVIATCDSHYLKKEHFKTHEIQLCIQTKTTLSDKKRFSFKIPEFYFMSEREVKEKLNKYNSFLDDENIEKAILETKRLSDRIDPDYFEFKKVIRKFSIPKEDENYNKFNIVRNFKRDSKSYFLYLLKRGWDLKIKNKISKDQLKKYNDRLKFELKVIIDLKFIDYFLIVHDIVKYAQKNNIIIGPGRGSSAGSLIAYLLDITKVDPIQYRLLFSRFLNKYRKGFPDIDIDFHKDKREKIMEYIISLYGKDKTSFIGSYGKMKSKLVLKDVGRVLGIDYSKINKLTKRANFLTRQHIELSLQDMIDLSDEFKKEKCLNEEWFYISSILENVVKYRSIHPSGMVIVDKNIQEYVSVRKDKEKILTEYDMHDLEGLGILKIDILGLATLDVIDDVCSRINLSPYKDINLNNEKVWNFICSGDCLGIFQLETKGMIQTIMAGRPKNIIELSSIIAAYRPGPIRTGMYKEFIDRKIGKSKVQYLIPFMKDILEETYGIILYQEQAIEIVKEIGFSEFEADRIRRIISKKKKLKDIHSLFIEKGKNKNIDENLLEELFRQIVAFAGYGFNKSHSICYALLSYITAYLKFFYPKEFLCACLNAFPKKKKQFLSECEKKNIEINLPDINNSNENFIIYNNKILFGLNFMINLGEKSIIEIKKHRPYKSFLDFCNKVDFRIINSKVLESLIKAGIFDNIPLDDSGYSISRKELLFNFKIFLKKKNKAIFKYNTFPSFIKEIDLYKWENSILGYSKHFPLDKYISKYGNKYFTPSLVNKKIKKGFMMGMLLSLKKIKTKTGYDMCFLDIADRTDKVSVTVFPKEYKKYFQILKTGECYLLKFSNDGKGNVANQIKCLSENE